jgi:pseudouridine synthase
MTTSGLRLQKFLSQAGIASRRHAEEMIAGGRVRVNGKRPEPGTRIDPASDVVEVDGRRIAATEAVDDRITVMVHKPPGYVSTRSDPEGRPTVLTLVPDNRRYLYPVGRLDYDSEGLLLLTNDGELANRLIHPRHEVHRTYRALVDRTLDAPALAELTRGPALGDGPTRPVRVDFCGQFDDGPWYEVVIAEGRKRQVRRMFAAVGAHVMRLIRTAMGPLVLGDLARGAHRPLTSEELDLLRGAHVGHRVSP